jgi:hypothetical protein
MESVIKDIGALVYDLQDHIRMDAEWDKLTDKQFSNWNQDYLTAVY